MPVRNYRAPVECHDGTVTTRFPVTTKLVAVLLVLLLAWCPALLLRRQPTSGPVHLCGNDSSPLSRIKLYVGVLSSALNHERRMAIRRTWGSDAGLERVVFVVPNPKSNVTLLESLRQQAVEFQDLMVVGHVMEHYFNISHQTLEVFRSAYAYHGDVTHVMKCDDDSYLHVARLLSFLAQHPLNNTFFGLMEREYWPDRKQESRFYVSKKEWPNDSVNLTWAYGSGYVLTKDLADGVATVGAYLCPLPTGKLFKLEDIALATWLQCLQQKSGVHVHVVNESRFDYGGCKEGDIVSHRRSAKQMACMFASNGQCC